MSTLDVEKAAMTGNTAAVLQVVSALRKYRAATAQALGTRYGDGTIDNYNASALCIEVEALESDLAVWDDG